MTVIKSTCKKAWLISDGVYEELRIICPDGSPVPFENIMKDLKPQNASRFNFLRPSEQLKVYIRMLSVKGGNTRITSNDVNYIGLDLPSLHGKVFLGGLGLGLDVLAICKNDNVDEVIIVEQTAGVIELIKPRLHHKKISIYNENPVKVFPNCNYNFMFWSNFQHWLFNKGSIQVTQNYLRWKYTKPL